MHDGLRVWLWEHRRGPQCLDSANEQVCDWWVCHQDLPDCITDCEVVRSLLECVDNNKPTKPPIQTSLTHAHAIHQFA